MRIKQILRATAAAALLAMAGAASAGLSVSSAIVGTGSTLFSDNSAEQWIDSNSNGVLDVGDRFRGILTIDTIENAGAATQIGGQSAYNELTGIYDVVVTGKSAQVGSTLGGTVPLFDFTFAASGALGDASTAVVLYEDAANDYTRQGCATIAACEATATGGNVWATFASVFWNATSAADNPSLGSTLPGATPLGTFGLGLNFLVNNTGFNWNNVNCLDAVTGVVSSTSVCGQGGILASGNGIGDLNTPYSILDNVDFRANVQVPEPGSLALVGLAMAGLGAASRRHIKRS